MKKLSVIFILALMLNSAFAQIPSDGSLSILIKSLTETNLSLIISNTQVDVLYEVQIKQNTTNWVSLGFENGSEITNCMLFISWFPPEFATNSHLPITAKSIRVRSWKSSYNDGVPDWWKIKTFGDVDIDAFGSPMGDGWATLVKFDRGMSPFKWYPPPTPSDYPFVIRAHYPEPPPFAELSKISERTIRNTILSVTAKQQTNGYELTVLKPIVHARYLLLVRDKNDRQWRASGYFVSETNRNPVILHVDKKGMMTDAQFPIALPAVKFLVDLVQPEFTAGWGEDSDGDGLPDIYEVLVTHTEPDNTDTGDTGIPDGFRVVSNDGWNNWDKFRFRVNPFTHCEPPPPVVLKKPTMSELIAASSLRTDLPYIWQEEFQTNSATGFQPYSLWVDSNYVNPDRSGHARCDVRVSWKVPPLNP